MSFECRPERRGRTGLSLGKPHFFLPSPCPFSPSEYADSLIVQHNSAIRLRQRTDAHRIILNAVPPIQRTFRALSRSANRLGAARGAEGQQAYSFHNSQQRREQQRRVDARDFSLVQLVFVGQAPQACCVYLPPSSSFLFSRSYSREVLAQVQAEAAEGKSRRHDLCRPRLNPSLRGFCAALGSPGWFYRR